MTLTERIAVDLPNLGQKAPDFSEAFLFLKENGT
jgi:hypothetical protein